MVRWLLYISVAVATTLLGFARYRTHFERRELLALLFVAVLVVVFGGVAEADGVGVRFDVLALVGVLGIVVLCYILFAIWRRIGRRKQKMSSLVTELAIDDVRMDGTDDKTIRVVLAAYNEADSIGDVIETLPESIEGYTVVPLVVSDGSTDDTAAVARRGGITVVEHAVNIGQCSALKTGFDIARRMDADIVVGMDADGQHRGDELERIVRPIIDGEVEYVIGSRYLGSDASGNGVVRRGGIWLFTTLTNLMTKSNITDATNGFRAIRSDALGAISLTEDRFCAVEILVEVSKNGLRMKEVPVTIEQRQSGTTKKPKLGYGIGIARTLFVTYFR